MCGDHTQFRLDSTVRVLRQRNKSTGNLTLHDIDNALSEDERNLILIEAKANKIDFKQLERAAQISDSSDSSPDIIKNSENKERQLIDIHSISLNKPTQKMNEKILLIRPDHLSGNEDVRKYLTADVNGWKDEDKIRFLSAFVKGTASTFLENMEDKHNNWTWDNLKQEFLDEFQPIGYNTILKARRQGDTESIMSFVTEIENICRKLNKNMNEDEICTYILKGLKETVLHAVSLHDNSNLKALKKNLKKFELMQF
ncbi:GATA zinc finger domain-containing protein 14-like [Aphis craccivora]|uniref:GATA zinc finger domain-containing protein 14-like n=1 Tax=Aphis craccivora TaxID=307492 RepID=A0A6G0YM18_APHCR|nr:GATA zinc finger domain-containing protein 14-like [Aphis craccivora]